MKINSITLPNGLTLVNETLAVSPCEISLDIVTRPPSQWYLEGELELPDAQATKLYEKGLAHTVRLDFRRSRLPRTLAGVRLPIRDIAAFRILRHVMELANG